MTSSAPIEEIELVHEDLIDDFDPDSLEYQDDLPIIDHIFVHDGDTVVGDLP